MAKRKVGNLEKLAKRADSMIDDAVGVGKMAVDEAKNTGKDITGRLDKEAKPLLEKGKRSIGDSLSQAKGINVSLDEQLNALERLAKLKDADVLTEEEFAEQKRKILARI